MKSGKVSTMKAVALGVAAMFIVASCGSSESTSGGRTKNNASCFENDDEKNLAINKAAMEFHTALMKSMQAMNELRNATSTTGASGGYRMPAVRSMDVHTTVPPVTTGPSSSTTQEPPTTAPATNETKTTAPETNVPSPNTLVNNELEMLHQALLNAGKQPLCETVNAASESNEAPYLNALTDVTATTNTDGSVVLNWTAPKASNVEPAEIHLYFKGSNNWGIYAPGSATSYKFDAEFLKAQNFSSGTFGLFPRSTGCILGGTGACFDGPSAEVAIDYPTSDTTDSTDSNAEPYLNPITNLIATTNTDGSVVLSWTAPKPSNVEPGTIMVLFGGIRAWVVDTPGSATSKTFDAEFLKFQNFSSGTFQLWARAGECARGTGACIEGPKTSVAIDYPTSDTTDSTDSNTEPYLNPITNLNATTNTDGSVVLSWTAPKPSNVEPGFIHIQTIGSSPWATRTRGEGSTSYTFSRDFLTRKNFLGGGFTVFARTIGCQAGGTSACINGPSTDVVFDYPNSGATSSTTITGPTPTGSTGSTSTTVAPTDTTIASLATDAPTDTTIATVTTDATATTVQANPEVVIIQTSLSAVELLTETPVLVTTDVVSMVCDEDCISTMFAAAALDSGTITINGVSASFGSESLRFPLDGKTGSIQAVVTSSDGKSALDMSTNFDRVEEIYAPVAPATAEAATSTSGSSKSIYIYVLIALLVLIVVGYMRRKKATETK